ncbi:MAG: hypothetical protein MJ183_07845 [Treponemataceae bacterium]|nr:hypothetical protein [Treponemataceae bacterium]
MKNTIKICGLLFAVSMIFVSCEKKPLTLGNETSMKALLKASDQEITELVKAEAAEKVNISADELDVQYILRDKDSQTIVVKSKIKSSGK